MENKEQQYQSVCESVTRDDRRFKLPVLHRFAFKGDVAGVEQCLREGGNVNEAIQLMNKCGDIVVGVTPLFLAAQQGHDPVVRLLLEEGADPSLKCTTPSNKQTFGPIDIAMTNLHLKVWWTLKGRESSGVVWPWSMQGTRSTKYKLSERGPDTLHQALLAEDST